MDINLKEIINKIDKKELEDFLVDELESNTSLYNTFVSRFANYMPDEDKNSYSTRILYAIYDAYDDDGYINYVKGANIAGFKKVADAMCQLGY